VLPVSAFRLYAGSDRVQYDAKAHTLCARTVITLTCEHQHSAVARMIVLFARTRSLTSSHAPTHAHVRAYVPLVVRQHGVLLAAHCQHHTRRRPSNHGVFPLQANGDGSLAHRVGAPGQHYTRVQHHRAAVDRDLLNLIRGSVPSQPCDGTAGHVTVRGPTVLCHLRVRFESSGSRGLRCLRQLVAQLRMTHPAANKRIENGSSLTCVALFIQGSAMSLPFA
jgi:hypothetical protein